MTAAAIRPDSPDPPPANDGWRETTLGEFAPFVYGKGLPKSKRNPNGGVPVYGSNGVIGFHDEALTDGPTIIIGRKGTIGAVHYSPVPCWPIDTTFFVEVADAELARFKYYAMSVLGMKDMNSDTAVPGLNRNSAHALAMAVPGESEQRRISAALGALDDKIALNARMNETLDEMASALFQAWFVDFVPVRAKMSGAWRRGESTPCLPAALYDMFPNAMEDSALGEIPAGWEVGETGDFFDLNMGQSPPGDTYNENGDGLPFFQGRADFDFRYPNNRQYCVAPKRVAKADDTLVSVRAPVGTINMAWERCCIGRGLAALRHKSGSASFTYYALKAMQGEIEQYEDNGTVFGSIGKRQFAALPTLEPPGAAIAAFGEYAAA